MRGRAARPLGARRLRLATAGNRKFLEGRQIAESLQTEILGVLSEVEGKAFLLTLERIAEACRAASSRYFPPTGKMPV